MFWSEQLAKRVWPSGAKASELNTTSTGALCAGKIMRDRLVQFICEKCTLLSKPERGEAEIRP